MNENCSLFSPVSLTPIVEYGHQQSRVEDNPKIPRREPQKPHKRMPILKTRTPN